MSLGYWAVERQLPLHSLFSKYFFCNTGARISMPQSIICEK